MYIFPLSLYQLSVLPLSKDRLDELFGREAMQSSAERSVFSVRVMGVCAGNATLGVSQTRLESAILVQGTSGRFLQFSLTIDPEHAAS